MEEDPEDLVCDVCCGLNDRCCDGLQGNLT